jgi:uncharacterized delta-60 repeat protein
VVQTDGKIIAVGYSEQTSTDADFALARYNPNGSLDASFGTGGKVTTDFAKGHDVAHAIALQRDGKLVVAGYSEQSGRGSEFALARYHPDGSLDTSFGTGGKVTTHFGLSTNMAHGVALQSDGKIIAVGFSYQGRSASAADFALARYYPDGRLDTGFGTGGNTIYT